MFQSIKTVLSVVAGIPILGDVVYLILAASFVSYCCTFSSIHHMHLQQKVDLEWQEQKAAESEKFDKSICRSKVCEKQN